MGGGGVYSIPLLGTITLYRCSISITLCHYSMPLPCTYSIRILYTIPYAFSPYHHTIPLLLLLLYVLLTLYCYCFSYCALLFCIDTPLPSLYVVPLHCYSGL